jgi:hypothetical protein
MNERIKNLSKKAWLLAHEANDQAEEDEGEELTEAEFGNVFQQKFAELIVRECITTMTNLEADVKQKFPWSKSEVISTSGHIQKLKEHFGVEE